MGLAIPMPNEGCADTTLALAARISEGRDSSRPLRTNGTDLGKPRFFSPLPFRERGWGEGPPSPKGAWIFAVGSQPSFLPCEPIRLDAIADAQLADGLGKVIPHRSLRQAELSCDGAGGQPFTGQAQHLPFALAERIAFSPGIHGELRLDHAPA